MKATNKFAFQIFALFLLMTAIIMQVNAYATDTEIFNGRYSYQSKDLILEFRLSNKGVEDAFLNGRKYGSSIESYDFLGDFGNSQLFEIIIEKSDTSVELIRLLIFHLDNRVKFVSGFITKVEYSQSRRANVKYYRTIDMNYDSDGEK
ncbi:MAG: hypothetical protein JW902_07925 [Syntrophaceae bacterium]|nr:hypothetical protein [Syntrophaceae bacterium]